MLGNYLNCFLKCLTVFYFYLFVMLLLLLLLFFLNRDVIALLEAVDDEEDTVLDEAGERSPELVLGDNLGNSLSTLNLPVVETEASKV